MASIYLYRTKKSHKPCKNYEWKSGNWAVFLRPCVWETKHFRTYVVKNVLSYFDEFVQLLKYYCFQDTLYINLNTKLYCTIYLTIKKNSSEIWLYCIFYNVTNINISYNIYFISCKNYIIPCINIFVFFMVIIYSINYFQI